MAVERVRFTAWLSKTERDGVTAAAAEHGSSDNYIVRLAVRQYLGLVNPVQTSRPPRSDSIA